ncbi:MAG TPA: DUF1464 family protein [Candidatus Methylomirabilis sp.]|nr:DUF1464 family protein [Candidatus Methylomirabilis sp.]
MTRVIGADPGTLSFDLCGLEDGRVFLEASIPADGAARDPSALVDRLTSALPLDLIAAPSGYGLPLTPVAEVGDAELDLLLLVREEDRGQPELVGGLRAMLGLMRERRLPAVVLPGVIHLPTVPAHRKVNRIDMGTADKLCVAALGIWDQARRFGLQAGETSFILVELGGAFTAALAVDGGRIVDGIGGAGGGLGYRALGTLDGEVAYALGHVNKSALFTGGAAFIAGDPGLPPELLAARAVEDSRARKAWDAFLECIQKMIASLRVSLPEPREVLLSGRLSRVPAVVDTLAALLGARIPVRRVGGFAATCKEAAQGAALIADGLAGGRHRDLVETMELRGAQGTLFDHLYVTGGRALRRQFGMPCES